MSKRSRVDGDKLLKQFRRGEVSAQEVHAALGVGKPCRGCNAPASIVLRTFVREDDLIAKRPQLAGTLLAMAAAAGMPGLVPKLPTVDMKYGKMVRVAEMAVCTRCAPEAERAAAKGPSWALVEIDRGPQDKRPIQVPAALQRAAAADAIKKV